MEEVRVKSRIIHPEVQSISRDLISETLNDRKTDPYFTRYEHTALIGTRALQLAHGAKPLVSLDGFILSSPRLIWSIAEKEILEKKLGAFIIHRTFPNGKDEYWSATELSVIW